MVLSSISRGLIEVADCYPGCELPVAPTEESHLIYATGPAIRVRGYALVLPASPDEVGLIEGEPRKPGQHVPHLTISLRGEPKDYVSTRGTEPVQMLRERVAQLVPDCRAIVIPDLVCGVLALVIVGIDAVGKVAVDQVEGLPGVSGCPL